MKKKLLFTIAACTFFLPSVVLAKAPEYVADESSVYANGTPITIEARTDGEEGALVKWDGGEVAIPKATDVFAGAHNGDVEEGSITMNGGSVYGIYGGGFHQGITKKTKIVINNGTVVTLMGGGMHSGITSCPDYKETTLAESTNRDTAVLVVDEAEIIINGGKITDAVWGGGQSYVYTGKVSITINNGVVSYAIASGSNGYTGDASITVNGGEIDVVQGVNRGEMNTITTTINGGKINTIYAAGESTDSKVNGVVNGSITLKVLDGEINEINAGTSGGPNSPATDITTAEINAKFEQKLGSDLDPETTEITVNLMLISGNAGETIQIPKGTTFTEDELQGLIDEINAEIAADKLKLEGFYLDEELTQEFDFSTPITQDMEIYMKLVELREDSGENNPETSDINLLLILSLVAVGAAGTTLVLKNRLS